jgi:hypothetical protein
VVEQLVEPAQECGQEQLALVREVVVEDAVGDARLARKIARRDRRHLALREQGLRRGDKVLAERGSRIARRLLDRCSPPR